MIKYCKLSMRQILGVCIGTAMAASAIASLTGYHGIRMDKIDASAGITLNQDISYHRGAKIYMQHGEVLERITYLYERKPYCYFGSNRSGIELDTPINIQATTFKITDLSNSGKSVSVDPQNSHVHFASFAGGGIGEGGAAQSLSLVTEFRISDPAQPQINKLVCAVWADPRDRGWVSLDEMQKAMGDVVTIRTN